MTITTLKMLRVLVALCLVGAALTGPPVSRSRSDIENFKDFLERTRSEKGVGPSNPESSEWENSGKYQGDILLDEDEIASMVDQYAAGRSAYIRPNTLWPARTIVYAFANGHYDTAQRNYVLRTINVLQSRTCIRFRPRNPGEFNYVYLTSYPRGCYASVGYAATRGRHTMNLSRNTPGIGCFNAVVITHEWLHVIGFVHMQSTYTRYNYVRINWANIQRGMEFNFNRLGNYLVNNLGLPYDYSSCMHYGARAFSTNGRNTIDALRAGAQNMGQRWFISGYDFWRVDRHYRCQAWRTLEDYKPYYEPILAKEQAAKEGLDRQEAVEKQMLADEKLFNEQFATEDFANEVPSEDVAQEVNSEDLGQDVAE